MIRPARPADLDALTVLEVQSFETDRLSRTSYRRLLGRRSAAVLIAEVDDAVRGSAVVLFRHGRPTARLYSLAVDPTCRGRGLGRALTDAALAEAAARGCTRLRLEVRDDNRAAIALYERLGFQLRDQVADYYADGMAARRYERTIPSPDAPQASSRSPIR